MLRFSTFSLLFILFFGLYGCGEFIQSKQYVKDFKLTPSIQCSIENIEESTVKRLLNAEGFILDSDAFLHVKISSNPSQSTCSVQASHIAKEHFIRISIYDHHVECYRIQLNQKEKIEEKDIQKVILRMKKEVM